MPIVSWHPEVVIGPVEAGFRPAAEELVKVAQALAPVRTGRLRASVRFESTGTTSGVLRADAPYAGYVEHGTNDTPRQPFLEEAAPSFRGIYVSKVRALFHLGF